MKATAFLTMATASSLLASLPAAAPPTNVNVATRAAISGIPERMFKFPSIDWLGGMTLRPNSHRRANHSLIPRPFGTPPRRAVFGFSKTAGRPSTTSSRQAPKARTQHYHSRGFRSSWVAPKPSDLALLALRRGAILLFEQPLMRRRGFATSPRLRASFYPKRPALRDQRAQGKPGVRCTRSLACENKKAHERSHHRSAGYTRPSLRNGFNGFLRARPGDRLLNAHIFC